MSRFRAWWRDRPRRRRCADCEVSRWMSTARWQRHQRVHRMLADLKTYLHSTS